MVDPKEGTAPVSSAPASSSLPPSLSLSTMAIDRDLWMVAEERAQEILNTFQPFFLSDRSRYEIISYVQTLVKNLLGAEVFNFGSVPLKTYLPDGDIDLTVLAPKDKEEDFAKALLRMLEAEEGRYDSIITNVEYVPAQVKLVKCRVKNIPVDISFNQMGGLCALCFLEQVNHIFGKDNLFKRSILLVKAWCFYEGRILGSSTGLISTYALAVLVLHIINTSYSSLSGPLSVLFKFLEYYASFDWSKYCLTVNGLVLRSSLPNMTETGQHEVVLSEKFVRECMELYSFPTRGVEANGPYFPVKFINIVDPMKHNNNLGRSVAEGNVKRLKRAFTRGFSNLKAVLTLPGETMGWRLEKFFGNTLEKNGKGERTDVDEPVTAFGTGRSELSELRGDFEGYFNCLAYVKWFHGETQSWIPQGTQDSGFWDIFNGQNNGSYGRNLNGAATSMQNEQRPRGTGTYIPDMSQQSYTDRFSSKPSRVKSFPSTSQS